MSNHWCELFFSLRNCLTCLSVFPSSAQGGDLLAWRRHADPFSYWRHYQQEGLPHPLHEHQVPGEPSYQEMTPHTACDLWPLCSHTTVTLTVTMATRKVQHVPSSWIHSQMWTFVDIRQPLEEDVRDVNICLPLVAPHKRQEKQRNIKMSFTKGGDVLTIDWAIFVEEMVLITAHQAALVGVWEEGWRNSKSVYWDTRGCTYANKRRQTHTKTLDSHSVTNCGC